MDTPKLLSPRPMPRFFNEAQAFSTKKERGTPRDSLPPKPPIKSCPPISRIFHNRQIQRAQVVSFKSQSDHSTLSPHYNEANHDLYFSQCFDIVSKLGAGSFGEVYKVRSKEDGKLYAVKRSRDHFKGESDRKRKLEEVAKHEQLPKQANCVLFHKAWEERQHLYIQTELCQTSLNNFADNNHAIPETIIWNYLVDLLMAVNHLHTNDLVHMDIKPENIFISGADVYDGVCKLGDFGLVLDISTGSVSDAQEGDPKYLAPELMDGNFGKAADVFSLGITILELASDLDLPRGGQAWHQLREGHLPEEFVNGRSDDLRRVIKWMMEPDPNTRPSTQDVLGDSVVKKVWRRRWRQQLTKSTIFKPMAVRTSTPLKAGTNGQHLKPPFGEWDRSFSDDDVFGDDVINVHDNSLGSPLDSSHSSDSCNTSKDNVFAVPRGMPPRKALTTPGGARHHTQPDIVTPRRSPVVNLSSAFNDQYTPDPSNSSSSRSSRKTINSSFNDFLEDKKATIGPKNLMDVFNGSSDEDA